jgi:hypothetical protein
VSINNLERRQVYGWFTKAGQDRCGPGRGRAISFEIPITIGGFRVDDAGRLEPIEAGTMPGFHFDWRGRPLHASTDGTRLLLEGRLGRVPSSAGSGRRDPAVPGQAAGRREDAFALMRGLAASIPPGWSLTLTPEHEVKLQVTHAVEGPLTAADLMAAVTRLLLTLGSYLDLLDEAGIT